MATLASDYNSQPGAERAATGDTLPQTIASLKEDIGSAGLFGSP